MKNNIKSKFLTTPSTYDWNNSLNTSRESNNEVNREEEGRNEQIEENESQLQLERDEIDIQALNNIQQIYGRKLVM